MAQKIAFHCLACNARIKAPHEMAGQTKPCPRCKTVFRVPEPDVNDDPWTPALDAEPILVMDGFEPPKEDISRRWFGVLR